MRRRASATSDCTTLMLSELKIRPRSVSSREHAFRMMMASGSSSSSDSVGTVNACVVAATTAVRAGGAPADSAGRTGVVFAEKSWSCVSRLIARRPELESKSVSVET